LAYENVLHYKFSFSEQDEEEAIHFFYKNSDSFQVDDSSKKISFNGRKVFVYIHGGYWQWGTIFASSFMAHNFTNKDIIVAAIGYQLCPKSRKFLCRHLN
jgi:acetyl esterase/lipase